MDGDVSLTCCIRPSLASTLQVHELCAAGLRRFCHWKHVPSPESSSRRSRSRQFQDRSQPVENCHHRHLCDLVLLQFASLNSLLDRLYVNYSGCIFVKAYVAFSESMILTSSCNFLICSSQLI
jgi:hypothetical protein